MHDEADGDLERVLRKIMYDNETDGNFIELPYLMGAADCCEEIRAWAEINVTACCTPGMMTTGTDTILFASGRHGGCLQHARTPGLR